MDPKNQRVKLNDGHFIPALGFGTGAPPEVPKSEAVEVTKFAIEAGFRHIDSAHAYQNEEQVGQAIRSKIADGTVKREDIFYTSKVWSTSLRPELVQPALEKSLKDLQLDYVDLYIIHQPVALMPGEAILPTDENGKLIFDSVDLCHTWEALEKCKDAGLTKSIGVSNFNHKQLERILNKPGLKYKPVCNQVECHPYLNQSKLLGFCKSHDIALEKCKDAGLTKSIGVSNFNHKQLEKILNKPGLKYKPVCNQVIPSLICPHSLLPPHQLTLPSFQQSHQMALPSFPVTSGHQLIQQNRMYFKLMKILLKIASIYFYFFYLFLFPCHFTRNIQESG
uniref:NADP-dependent oxidoreductase domain-containing protein n=1 Tax=Capra hircus TaxID=9925 RepID=A0A8C2RLY1_CAPHI